MTWSDEPEQYKTLIEWAEADYPHEGAAAVAKRYSADDAWASCDGQFGTDRWRKGQEQANRLKAALRDRVGTWLGIKGPLPA